MFSLSSNEVTKVLFIDASERILCQVSLVRLDSIRDSLYMAPVFQGNGNILSRAELIVKQDLTWH